MKRITDISQLKKGDVIVSIYDDREIRREFLCIHPHNDKYSLFLNELQDGCEKFYNSYLKTSEWYLFTKSKEDYNEIDTMVIESLKKSISLREQSIYKRQRSSSRQETEIQHE